MSTSPTSPTSASPSPSSTSAAQSSALQSSAPPAPLQQITLTESDLANPSQFVSILNQNLTNLFQLLNSIAGFGGEINFNNHINLNGKTIKNVGAAAAPGDVVTKAFGDSIYGAAAVVPQIQALGKQVAQSFRRLNDSSQREKASSFLNSILNTSPTSNTSSLTFGSAGGGSVPVTVTAGFHQYVDGSTTPYNMRSDTLPLPVAITITSLVRSGNIVTATTAAPHGLVQSEGFNIVGTSDPTFDGAFSVLSVTGPNTFTYFQGGPNATSTGGSLDAGGVYYYTISRGQNSLGLVSGVGADTWSERIKASADGTTIIAVVVLNSGGGDILNSGSGATAPAQGAAIPVIRRM